MRRSEELFAQAQQLIPGGVNSPVRAFSGVGGTPIFFKQGDGAYVQDEEGKQYLDFTSSWGPLILGHANPEVVSAVHDAVDRGLSFGTPTEIENRMAEFIQTHVPSVEQVRMVSSGTEATMSALRLARAYTQRDKVLKFKGCYHGHNDAFLVEAGSGALTLGVPSSPGVPSAVVEHTVVAEFNQFDQIKACFEEHGADLAAVMVEPVAGNMGCVLPQQDFLQGLRQLCDDYGTVLIFDEVITGFRLGLGGAQAYYGVTPDLTTMGKIIGGGMPVGAYGGKADMMAMLAPTGPVYQAGTLSGNPVAMTAGLTVLQVLARDNPYVKLLELTEQLTQGLLSSAKNANIPLVINQVGSMFSLFFTTQSQVTSFNDVMACDVERFKVFYHGMLEQGIYFGPSAYETAFLSTAFVNADVEKTLIAAETVFAKL